jgi:drug/metabolite transporter (DMT)-like permease
MRENGDPNVQGFWLTIVGIITHGVILLIWGRSILITPIIISSLIVGFANAIGFLSIIMYCLKIGPSGLTTTVNNSSLVFGVIYSVVFLNPHIPNIPVIIGIFGSITGLILIGISSLNENNNINGISKRWVKLVMIGGVFSGISFINQVYIGTCHPGIHPLIVFIFWMSLFTMIILSILIFYTKAKILSKKEIIGGLSIGFLANISLFFTIFSLNYIGAEVILPVTVATPMVLMLFLGHYLYGEHLNIKALTGAGIAIFSVILLSVFN